MLLTKGSLHRLIRLIDPKALPAEVHDVLALLTDLFSQALPAEETGEQGPT